MNNHPLQNNLNNIIIILKLIPAIYYSYYNNMLIAILNVTLHVETCGVIGKVHFQK